MYEGSILKTGNDAELLGALDQGSARSDQATAEVASPGQRATGTPCWWGIWVMLRVSPFLLPGCCLFILLDVLWHTSQQLPCC